MSVRHLDDKIRPIVLDVEPSGAVHSTRVRSCEQRQVKLVPLRQPGALLIENELAELRVRLGERDGTDCKQHRGDLLDQPQRMRADLGLLLESDFRIRGLERFVELVEREFPQDGRASPCRPHELASIPRAGVVVAGRA